MDKKNNWYKLDNAAKLFPATTTSMDPKIFRFSCHLKEDINIKNLEKSLNLTLKEFPIFKSVLKKGLFWYYLEKSDITPKVSEEHTSPCEKLSSKLLFEVTYYKNKINLEVYHALSDGGGCIPFFETLIYNYLKLTYNIKEDIILNKSSKYEQETDSFKKYYDPKVKIKISKRPLAHQIKGYRYPEGKLKIIEGVTSTSKVKEVAHSYNTTITGLLCGLLIKSIEETMSIKEKNKEISITLPIDLRRHFKSNTIRNFFNVTNINYKCTNNNSLEKIIEVVNNELKENLKPENISANMNRLIFLEKFLVIRLVPLFIKNPILKFSYDLTRSKQTIGLSNVGIINLPDECEKYIEFFSVFNSIEKSELCILSYKEKICFAFSSHYINSEIEKNFFRHLKSFNLDLDIYTNNLEGSENHE